MTFRNPQRLFFERTSWSLNKNRKHVAGLMVVVVFVVVFDSKQLALMFVLLSAAGRSRWEEQRCATHEQTSSMTTQQSRCWLAAASADNWDSSRNSWTSLVATAASASLCMHPDHQPRKLAENIYSLYSQSVMFKGLWPVRPRTRTLPIFPTRTTIYGSDLFVQTMPKRWTLQRCTLHN